MNLLRRVSPMPFGHLRLDAFYAPSVMLWVRFFLLFPKSQFQFNMMTEIRKKTAQDFQTSSVN
jgi:hypothetical protein